MRKIPPLHWIQAFEAAARLGSFVQASQELHLTASAVSHRIRSLEALLSIPLFHRIRRTVLLTDAGQRFANEVGIALTRIESAAQDTSRVSKADLITVHSVPSFAAQWLMPRIARFSTQHPEIDVRITAAAEPINLEIGAIDLHIGYGPQLQRNGIVTEMFPPEPIVAICSPTLLKGRRGIKQTTDMQKQMLIHSERNIYQWKDWQNDHQGISLRLDRGLRFDRSFMSIFAAVDGLGVCLDSKLLIERQLDSGRLVLPFGDEGPRLACHSINYLTSRAHLPKIRAFREWLMKSLEKTPALAK
jgi:LysR family transcriptional regulator, glycine cleavage system transcriptional activator